MLLTWNFPLYRLLRLQRGLVMQVRWFVQKHHLLPPRCSIHLLTINAPVFITASLIPFPSVSSSLRKSCGTLPDGEPENPFVFHPHPAGLDEEVPLTILINETTCDGWSDFFLTHIPSTSSIKSKTSFACSRSSLSRFLSFFIASADCRRNLQHQ